MHPCLRSTAGQQQCLSDHAKSVDSYAFFNLLTGPQLLAGAKELLPDHRERRFPPTETLSMFLAQVLSADGSCRQAARGWFTAAQHKHQCRLSGAGASNHGDDLHAGAQNRGNHCWQCPKLVGLAGSPGQLNGGPFPPPPSPRWVNIEQA